MVIKFASKTKQKLVAGKTYIGTGLYKDADDCVWNLAKEGDDWIITRNASIKYDSTKDENYWAKVLGKEMARSMYKRKLTAHTVEAQIDSNPFIASITLIDQDNVSVKATVSQKGCLKVGSAVIDLPEGIKDVFASFEGKEALEVLAEVVGSDQFADYVTAMIEVKANRVDAPKIEKMKEGWSEESNKGRLPAYSFPGGYPLYYITKDGGVLCADCANDDRPANVDEFDAQWYITDAEVNYEDDSLYCDNCGKQIESAYGNEII